MYLPCGLKVYATLSITIQLKLSNVHFLMLKYLDSDHRTSPVEQQPSYLDISCNKLTCIEPLVTACSNMRSSLGNLVKLYLSENHITSIPGNLSQVCIVIYGYLLQSLNHIWSGYYHEQAKHKLL